MIGSQAALNAFAKLNPRSQGMKRKSMFAGNQTDDSPAVEYAKFQELAQDVAKNKLQLNILSFFLKNYVNTNEDQKVDAINRQIEILQQHEHHVQTILNRFQNEQKKLHFAFLFASPLVLSSGGENGDKIKLMPTLNYTKEFIKIKDSVHSA